MPFIKDLSILSGNITSNYRFLRFSYFKRASVTVWIFVLGFFSFSFSSSYAYSSYFFSLAAASSSTLFGSSILYIFLTSATSLKNYSQRIFIGLPPPLSAANCSSIIYRLISSAGESSINSSSCKVSCSSYSNFNFTSFLLFFTFAADFVFESLF